MDQFFISLPSNVNSNKDANTMANFRTQLFKTIQLPVDYEVGLAEISFPALTQNDPEFEIGIFKIKKIQITNTFAEQTDSRQFSVKRKHFLSHDSMIVFINTKFEEIAKELNCSPPPILERFSENKGFRYGFNNFSKSTANTLFYVTVYGELADMIGFAKSGNVDYNIEGNTTSHGLVEWIDMISPTDMMYIYTDIINYQFVGDTYTQLLRTVPIGAYMRSQTVYYSSPHYVPVASNIIDLIQITIKDDNNQFIKFTSGTHKVIVKLHFRPKQYGF